MRRLRQEWSSCILPEPTDGRDGKVAYLLWILSYALRWPLAIFFKARRGFYYDDWQLIDLMLNLGLSLAAAFWFAFRVPNPKDRPRFVIFVWLVSRCIWETIHPIMR